MSAVASPCLHGCYPRNIERTETLPSIRRPKAPHPPRNTKILSYVAVLLFRPRASLTSFFPQLPVPCPKLSLAPNSYRASASATPRGRRTHVDNANFGLSPAPS